MTEKNFSFNTRVGDDQYTIRGDTFEEFWKNYDEQMAEISKRFPQNPPQPSNGQQAPGEPLFIEVENIKLASGGDNPRWVVQGGNFKQYGITCWPEVLEEADLLQYLDPMKDNPPKVSLKAYYLLKTNDKGKEVPDKVVKVVKA